MIYQNGNLITDEDANNADNGGDDGGSRSVEVDRECKTSGA